LGSGTFETNVRLDPVVESGRAKEPVAAALEEDAQIMSNTQLEQVLVGQPPATEDEIIRGADWYWT
jgi:hypothetical protein